jgi:adenine-specific DNA-methyltransferase
MSNFEALVSKLREIFQIDRADLDFGVYRILNARAAEIDTYLTKRLKERVVEALDKGTSQGNEGVNSALQAAIKAASDAGFNPDDSPKVIELRAQLAGASAGAAEHEAQVFSHLLTFFSRYYDKGDFISQRRYKGDTYAIPYAGEEVMLHWANRDQYYTKSGEAFSNYSFKLDAENGKGGRTVHFRLVAADTAKDNRKDNDKARMFKLAEARTVSRTDDDGETIEETILPVAEENGDLVIRFDYVVVPAKTKQDALVSEAVTDVLGDEAVQARWLDLKARMPTDKNPTRTLLEKHLATYTQKNSADYFIHKDLGTFLRRELDFYIKNEVMNLDDIQDVTAFAAIEKNLVMIQTLRAIAQDLITFLASIEDFQKKLWLKKKFVVSSHWCVTLDRVPEALYPAIAANPAQWAAWHDLGLRDSAKPGTAEELKASPFMMVDTSLFDAAFRADLLKSINNLDAQMDGLLVHGDNFQALNLLQDRYREQVKCVYIDPPYNTDANAIIYKNGYKHSTWLSLLESRLSLSKNFFLLQGAVQVTAIDEVEIDVLKMLLGEIHPEQENTLVSVTHNPGGTLGKNFSKTGEFMLFNYTDEKSMLAKEDRKDNPDIRDLMNTAKGASGDYLRASGKTCFYPIFVKNGQVFGFGDVCDDDFHPTRNVLRSDGIIEVYPIDADNVERKWVLGRETAPKHLHELSVKTDKKTGLVRIERTKSELNFKTVWTKSEYSAKKHGTELLGHIIPETRAMDRIYPKSLHLVSDAVWAATGAVTDSIIMDYFGGSGTTGHAAIALKRSKAFCLKYILAEQGDHFDKVLRPRLQKVVFSAEWSNGKPTAPATGISNAFKVLKLESYEDTVNNLNLSRAPAQSDLLAALPTKEHDAYLMSYMLDVESRGSLLSVEDFKKPFDYRLKIAVDSAGAWAEQNVDLVETFNYLIGLTVKSIDMQWKQGFVTVEGTLPSGERALILWRDCDKVDYEGLQKLCDRLAINPGDREYDVIYINGDHTLPSVLERDASEGGDSVTVKLRQIEPAFLSAMFDVADV